MVVPKSVSDEGAGGGGGGGPELVEKERGGDASRENHGCHGLVAQVLRSWRLIWKSTIDGMSPWLGYIRRAKACFFVCGVGKKKDAESSRHAASSTAEEASRKL